MKKIYSALLGLAALGGCHKMDDHDHMNMVNIDYAAAYVVNGQDNNVQVINLNNLTANDKISLSGATYPHHIYLSPDRSKLAVAITGADLSGGHSGHSGMSMEGLKIQIINAQDGMLEHEIGLSQMPHNAVFDPSGQELWVGQLGDVESQVLVYETSGWTLKHTIRVGAGLSEVTFSHDGRWVFAANTAAGTVSIIDANQKRVYTTLSVGQNPVGAWPASNGHMYVDNENSQTISEMATDNPRVLRTISLGFKPGYVAYHGNSGELWVSDATNGRVVYYRFDTNTNQWSPAGNIPTGADAHAIAFDASGNTAYVTNQGANTVSVISTASHTVTQTIAVGNKPNGIVIR